MKKIGALLVIITVLVVVLGAAWGSANEGGERHRTVVIEKQGRRVEVSTSKEASMPAAAGVAPQYRGGALPFDCTAQERAQVATAIKRAFQSERAAMLENARNARKAAKRELATSFAGLELDKRARLLDENDQVCDQAGLRMISGGVSKCELRGLTVTGDTAVVIADETTWVMYKNKSTSDPQESQHRVENGRQHTISLMRRAGRWLITEDSWVFIPGQGP